MSNPADELEAIRWKEEYVRNRDAIWECLTGDSNRDHELKLLTKLLRLDYVQELVLIVVDRQSTQIRDNDTSATERGIVTDVLQSTGYFEACTSAIEKIAEVHMATVVKMTIVGDGIHLCQQKDFLEMTIPENSDIYVHLMDLMVSHHSRKFVFIESDLMDRGSIGSTDLKPVSLEVATHFLRRGFV